MGHLVVAGWEGLIEEAQSKQTGTETEAEMALPLVTSVEVLVVAKLRMGGGVR